MVKIALSLFFVLLLSACASTNKTALELSNAIVEGVNVIKSNESKAQELDITFSYSIDNFHKEPNLYTCAVMFVKKSGSSVNTSYNPYFCKIKAEQGFINVRTKTPFHPKANYSKKQLQELTEPLQYFVSIHQQTGKMTNTIIGKSDVMTLD